MTEQLPVSAENEAECRWTLWREDIYGNQYRMPLDFAGQVEADQAEADYTAKGHHQTYFVKSVAADDTTAFIPGAER